jgi:hypothetical protein
MLAGSPPPPPSSSDLARPILESPSDGSLFGACMSQLGLVVSIYLACSDFQPGNRGPCLLRSTQASVAVFRCSALPIAASPACCLNSLSHGLEGTHYDSHPVCCFGSSEVLLSGMDGGKAILILMDTLRLVSSAPTGTIHSAFYTVFVASS